MYIKVHKEAEYLKKTLFSEHLFDSLLYNYFMLQFIAVSHPK